MVAPAAHPERSPDLRKIACGPFTLRYPWLRLALLTGAAFLIEGYHFGVDDAEIYIPAIKKFFDPRLYPFGSEFFLSHARLSVFAPVVGLSARLLHLSVESAVLLWYLVCLFLILVAGWQLARIFFLSARAHWGAVALLAVLLPVPVAGTALVLSDNYFSARSFSTPFALLSIGFFLRGRLRLTFLWLLLTALFHPQMAVYCAAFLALLRWVDAPANARSSARLAALIPARLSSSFTLTPAGGLYRQVLGSRTFFFASLWHWYEWVGVIAPLLLLALLSGRNPLFARPDRLHERPDPRHDPGATSPATRSVSRALLLLGVASTSIFLILSVSPHLDSFARLQPMRSFHIIYLLLFLLLGGLIGEHMLDSKLWRWGVLFLPLTAGMFALERSQYPFSPHIEWPRQSTSNPWLEAFAWVRVHTPAQAVFALDPDYLAIPGEDDHGFRALADRSALADFYKDSGAVTMFPTLLADWETQQHAQQGWRHFRPADFERLSRISPVTWVIVQHPQQTGLICPYSNSALSVCRLSAAH